MNINVIQYSVALALIALTNLFEFINRGFYFDFQLVCGSRWSNCNPKTMIGRHCATVNLLHTVAYNAVSLASYSVGSKGLANVEFLILIAVLLSWVKYYLYTRVLKHVVDTRCSISNKSRIICNVLNWAEMIIIGIAILRV